MKRDARIKLFSFKRLVLSLVMGFLFLVSYLAGLFLIDSAGKKPPNAILAVIGWPRWLWILLGVQFSDDSMVSGLTFFAACDTLLYAAVAYAVLSALSTINPRRAAPDPPPPPTPGQFHTSPANS